MEPGQPDLAGIRVPALLVLRHGETEWNLAGKLQGALDSPLTEKGQKQAQQQGAILASLGAMDWNWYSSPQGRAAETARLAGGVDVTRDARLREIEMGEWSGRYRADLAEESPELFGGAHLAWYDHAPGGEGTTAVAIRVAAFLAELTGPSVIVTHGITSRIIRCLVLGRPVEDFGLLEGGQGVVHHVENGETRCLEVPQNQPLKVMRS
ncbi:MAG: histidine phosphatase family protein [Paracoccaceae bacterium]